MADLRKESYMMLTSKHPNLVKEHATFIDCNFMWIVMNILDGGSLADIMQLLSDPKTKQKGIRDEVLIATIINETMKALAYFHQNGKIHRDIKAGNILLDMEGHVYLSDFGVSASLKKGQKRGTLVGSPCWMAPEIMSQHGHEFNADVWSLGITAQEIALGDPPYSKYTAAKVVALILQEAPPHLPATPWSQEFRHFVECCLVKNPKQRPPIDWLFKHCKSFLDLAKDSQYIKKHLTSRLPPQSERLVPAF